MSFGFDGEGNFQEVTLSRNHSGQWKKTCKKVSYAQEVVLSLE